MITANRYHDISCGHRVVGHESKCKFLHGHNYRLHFTIASNTPDDLDDIGRVLDFGVIKTHLCEWLEQHWDHKFLIWDEDPMLEYLMVISPESMLPVPFNPTAENMAKYMVEIVGPHLLNNTGTHLVKCVIEETRKCSAAYEITGK